MALEVDSTSKRLVFRDVVLTVPRQSGKSTLLLVLILLRALSQGRQNVKYTAQTGSDARKKVLDDWLPQLKASEFGKTFHPRLTSGHEALQFNNGSALGLVATTLKAGHGSSLDLVILDESFAHPDARLEQALKPAMMTRPQPQFWVVSTAGTRDASPYLWEKVENGRKLAEAGVNEGICYFEWSAEDDADPADPETWRSCMPALGLTVSEDAVAADARSMDVSEFRRAYLNQWVTSMVDPVISMDTWNDLIDPKSTAQNPVSLSFDVTPDRSRSAIAVAGHRSGGEFHVEVIDHLPGTAWVPERIAELVRKHRPGGVFCDALGPAGSLVAELTELKVEVTQISAREHSRSCGLFYDTVMEGHLHHLGQAELTAALDGAVKRSLGDAWAWSRRSSAVDICPLVAVTLALGGCIQHPPAPRARYINLNTL
ncbi:MAG: terminase large subunit [Acidimicrobiales bacterium]